MLFFCSNRKEAVSGQFLLQWRAPVPSSLHSVLFLSWCMRSTARKGNGYINTMPASVCCLWFVCLHGWNGLSVQQDVAERVTEAGSSWSMNKQEHPLCLPAVLSLCTLIATLALMRWLSAFSCALCLHFVPPPPTLSSCFCSLLLPLAASECYAPSAKLKSKWGNKKPARRECVLSRRVSTCCRSQGTFCLHCYSVMPAQKSKAMQVALCNIGWIIYHLRASQGRYSRYKFRIIPVTLALSCVCISSSHWLMHLLPAWQGPVALAVPLRIKNFGPLSWSTMQEAFCVWVPIMVVSRLYVFIRSKISVVVELDGSCEFVIVVVFSLHFFKLNNIFKFLQFVTWATTKNIT